MPTTMTELDNFMVPAGRHHRDFVAKLREIDLDGWTEVEWKTKAPHGSDEIELCPICKACKACGRRLFVLLEGMLDMPPVQFANVMRAQLRRHDCKARPPCIHCGGPHAGDDCDRGW